MLRAPETVVRNFRCSRRTSSQRTDRAIFTAMIAATFLILLGIYLACGLLFAVPFALFGVKKIDPHAAHGSWGFHLLILPGALAFWPLLLRRWRKGISVPPEKSNAHRVAARSDNGQSAIANPKSA